MFEQASCIKEACSSDNRVLKNPKFEFLNSKQLQNSNVSMTKTAGTTLFPLFEFWSFEFVSCFGFRYSDLRAAKSPH